MTVNVYESKSLQRILGTTIRPGGLFLTEKAVSLCGLKKGAKILDVGCGAGATANYLKESHGMKAFGIDLSLLLLHQGRKRDPGLELFCGSAAELPIPGSTFQAVFCECVLSLTRAPSSVMAEFYRVLIPGGFLILTDIYRRGTPDIEWESSSSSVNCCLNGAMGKDRIQSITARNGFNIFFWEDHTPLLKTLAARMVLAFGSLEQFWSSFDCGKDSLTVLNNNTRMKPGYYLMAAKKGA